MTTGLLKSCQVRDKMLKNITKNKIKPDSPAYLRYKRYRNMLTDLTRKQKKKHYDILFVKHKNDIKKTLDLVNGIINRSNDKHSLTSTRFKVEEKWVDNDQDIANGNKEESGINEKVDEEKEAEKEIDTEDEIIVPDESVKIDEVILKDITVRGHIKTIDGNDTSIKSYD